MDFPSGAWLEMLPAWGPPISPLTTLCCAPLEQIRDAGPTPEPLSWTSPPRALKTGSDSALGFQRLSRHSWPYRSLDLNENLIGTIFFLRTQPYQDEAW